MRVIRKSTGLFYSRILLKIFEPGSAKPKTQEYRPQPGKILTEKNVNDILSTVVHKIENEWYVGHDYRFVTLTGGQFNFIHEDDCQKCRAAAA